MCEGGESGTEKSVTATRGENPIGFLFFPDRLSLSLPLAASLFLLIRPFCQRIDDPKFRSFNLSYFPAANSSRRNNFARLVNDASDSLFLTFDHCSTSPQSLDSPLTI